SFSWSCVLFVLSLFLLLFRRSPVSTLFPYTTLFRSASGLVCTTGKSYLGTMSTALATTGVDGLKVIISESAISSWYDYYRENGLDRKSTRLNSSHVSISYAVFCLKKKKKWCYKHDDE